MFFLTAMFRTTTGHISPYYNETKLCPETEWSFSVAECHLILWWLITVKLWARNVILYKMWFAKNVHYICNTVMIWQCHSPKIRQGAVLDRWSYSTKKTQGLLRSNAIMEFSQDVEVQNEKTRCCSVRAAFLPRLVAAILISDMTSFDQILQSHDVIKWKHFLRYWPLCEQFIGHRWIPLTKASDAELWCFLWSAPEHTVE